MNHHVIVIGEMGVGKTTVGEALAAELGWPFLDSDDHIESREGRTGSRIVDGAGVEALHALEFDVFLELVSRSQPSVIAPAASVVDHEEGRRALKENTTVWLVADDDVLARRQRMGHHRRSVTRAERVGLRRRREPHLESIASVTVDTSTTSVDETVSQVRNLL